MGLAAESREDEVKRHCSSAVSRVTVERRQINKAPSEPACRNVRATQVKTTPDAHHSNSVAVADCKKTITPPPRPENVIITRDVLSHTHTHTPPLCGYIFQKWKYRPVYSTNVRVLTRYSFRIDYVRKRYKKTSYFLSSV